MRPPAICSRQGDFNAYARRVAGLLRPATGIGDDAVSVGTWIATGRGMWNPNQYRESHRRPSHDYAGPGAWLVTINSFEGRHCFGSVVDRKMILNRVGSIVTRHWQDAPRHHPNLRLDAFVVMPNHVHLLVILTRADPRLRTLQERAERFGKPIPGSLGTIMRSFKSACTRDVRRAIGSAVELWHERYDDRTLRTPKSIQRARFYIGNNPARWQEKKPLKASIARRIINVEGARFAIRIKDDEWDDE